MGRRLRATGPHNWIMPRRGEVLLEAPEDYYQVVRDLVLRPADALGIPRSESA